MNNNRYSFSLTSKPVVLGEACSLQSNRAYPSIAFRPTRIVTNAPIKGFVTFNLRIANIDVFSIDRQEDAYTYNAENNVKLPDLSVFDISSIAMFSAHYSGLVPEGFIKGAKFWFIVTMFGDAIVTR